MGGLLLEIAVTSVVLAPLLFAVYQFLFHDFGKSIRFCIFSCYLMAVYILVGLPNVTYVRFELNGNLIPFAGMASDVRSTLQNVALFFPLGVMLPLLWERYRNIRKMLPFAFILSLTIELLQIFTYRATDVNDLITNTFGAFLGWLIAAGLPKIRYSGSSQRELYILLALTFAGMFFLHPIVSSFLWQMI